MDRARTGGRIVRPWRKNTSKLTGTAENIYQSFDTYSGHLSPGDVLTHFPPTAWLTFAVLVGRGFLRVDEVGFVHTRGVKPQRRRRRP